MHRASSRVVGDESNLFFTAAWLARLGAPRFPRALPQITAKYPLLRLTSRPILLQIPSQRPSPHQYQSVEPASSPSGTSGSDSLQCRTVAVGLYNNGGRAVSCWWPPVAEGITPPAPPLSNAQPESTALKGLLVQHHEDLRDSAAAAPAGDSHGPTRQAARLRSRAAMGHSRSTCFAKSRQLVLLAIRAL